MGRLKGLGSFLLITGAVFLALRLFHVAIPLFHTGGPTGPVFLDSLDSVAPVHRFFLRAFLPTGRRNSGARPDRDYRHPPATSSSGDRLAGRALDPVTRAVGRRRPRAPCDRRDLSGPSRLVLGGARGALIGVVLKQDEVWIEVWTDLDLSDLQRVLNSLRPY